MQTVDFTVVVMPENKSFSSWCPDLDVASQGKTAKEAIANLKEAIELHIECLAPSELGEVKERRNKKIMASLKLPLHDTISLAS